MEHRKVNDGPILVIALLVTIFIAFFFIITRSG